MEDLDTKESAKGLSFLDAISCLDAGEHIKTPSRNEPTNLTSEFNLVKTSKLDINNVVKVLDKTAKHVQLGKNLKKVQNTSKVLSKPLEKPQAERIKRSTGFEVAKEKLGRWDAVVARARTVDYVSFPLKPAKNKKIEPTKEFLSRFKFKSELEKELEAIDPPTFEESEDEVKNYPMTYQEMLEHRNETAKFRAQQSFKAAKAKRQGKIKSKKYHRILKKEKLKQQIKEFEELQKTDPEQALKKLEELEKARALERHTLRHKNTGKWAKSKLVRAKYDKDVRQQLSEQLAISRGLTKKTKDTQSSDDEPENEIIQDITLQQDPDNPWMLKKSQSDKSNVESEFDFGYKKYVQQKKHYSQNSSSSDSESKEKIHHNKSEIKDFSDIIAALTKNDKKMESDGSESDENSDDEKSEVLVNRNAKENKISQLNISRNSAKYKKPVVSTSIWEVENISDSETNGIDILEELDKVYDEYEENIEKKVEQKLGKLKKEVQKIEKRDQKLKKNWDKKKNCVDDSDELSKLELKSSKKIGIVDESLDETISKVPNAVEIIKDAQKILNAESFEAKDKSNVNIDPTRFMKVKPKHLASTLSFENNDMDNLDDEEQVVPKVNIEDVFEEDDVVDSFRKEKEDEIEKDTPKDIDLSLPGWGSWGGKGIKQNKRKKHGRLILKAPFKMARRDENKGDIIIKEYKDPKLAVHKVSEVPFPFTSVKEYEASIRAPIGNTFVPESAHQKLIKPSVFTKAGTVIEPMDEDQLSIPKNKKFKNESVLKLLCKK